MNKFRNSDDQTKTQLAYRYSNAFCLSMSPKGEPRRPDGCITNGPTTSRSAINVYQPILFVVLLIAVLFIVVFMAMCQGPVPV
jgi:hypothetical protein